MNDLLKKAKVIYDADEYESIQKAYAFAAEAHKDQKRISGEDYIAHPTQVAKILIDLGLDVNTIIAALLHDVLEDTSITEETMKAEFGNEVLEMVKAVTKLNRFDFNTQEEEQAENIRRLFLAMAKDIRVLLIKLADRLHNMRTLQYIPPKKQVKKAKETLDIFAALAGRLGISSIKCELEDLAMKYLFPEDYDYLAQMINIKRDERMVFVDRVANIILERLEEAEIKGEVRGRPKHFYSIYKKMKKQGKTFDQIYDLVAVRVVVETVRDCYSILGIIHSMWKPIPGRFKDYIAMPKPNFYQSLHTTVMTDFGQVFEIQIRTYEMNKIAEYGIAAHWKYKEGKITTAESDLDRQLGFIKEVMDVQGELKDSIEFLDTLKLNVAANEIFIFSPKGDVFNLPVSSTCIDFAYKLHTEIGNSCVGAKINSRMVPLSTELSNGDVIEIITSKNSKGPSRDWLKIVKTPSARAKIRSFFKKAMKAENIKTGREMLERDAKQRGYNLSDLMQSNWVKIILERYSLSEVNDLYASIGYGGHSTKQILIKLIEFYRKKQELKKPPIEETEIIEQGRPATARHKRQPSGILIEGYDDFLIRLSNCCHPIPGDKIIGYVSRGRGVSVHRIDCPNLKNIPKERLLKAEWDRQSSSTFKTFLQVRCEDRTGILSELSSAISSLKYSIYSMNARIIKPQVEALVHIGVEINSVDELEDIKNKIMGIDGVIEVKRSIQ